MGTHAERLRRRAVGIFLMALVGVTSTVAITADATDDPPPGAGASDVVEARTDVVVELDAGSEGSDVDAVIEAAGLPDDAIVHRFEIVPGFSASLTQVEIDRLLNEPRVAFVRPNETVTPFANAAIPYVNADDVHLLGYRGDGWTVAVIDTGVETGHPMLTGKVGGGITGNGAGGACFTTSGTCPGGGAAALGATAAQPCTGATFCSHGTRVSGLAVGNDVLAWNQLGNPTIATSGVAPDSSLYPIRVAASDGAITAADLLAGLDHVWTQRDHYRFAAVNLSLGIDERLFGTFCDASSPFATAIDRLVDEGIAVVAATGNSSQNIAVADPACVENATAVTAMYYRNYSPSFPPAGSLSPGNLLQDANIAPIVDLAAPGFDMRTSTTGSGYWVPHFGGFGETGFSGTSAAAPMVSGAYALLRDACPGAPLQSLTDALQDSPTSTFERAGLSFPVLDVGDAFGRLFAGKPGAISSVAAVSPSDGTVRVSWAAAAGANGYLITDSQTGERLVVGNVVQTTWTDRAGGGRSFTVLPLRDGCRGDDPAATTNSVSIQAPPPPPPTQPPPTQPPPTQPPPTQPPPTQPPTDPPTDDDGSTAAFESLSPGRFADTRAIGETIDGLFEGDGKLAADEEYTVTIAGRGDVPADAAAAIMNVTAILPDDLGFVTAHPCVTPRPLASSLNYPRFVSLGNEIVAPLDDDGNVCIFTSAAAHIAVDVTGYVPADSTTIPITPARFLDTRPGEGTFDGLTEASSKLEAGITGQVRIAGRGDVPANAVAVIANVTAIAAEDGGFITVDPCSPNTPNAASLNYTAGVNRGNEVIASLDSDGNMCLFTSTTVHLTVDIVGYLPSNTDIGFITPSRFLDTRPIPVGDTIDEVGRGGGKLDPGEQIELRIAGRGDVPSNATSAVVNVTAVLPETTSYVTVHPCTSPRPLASSLNYVADVNGGNEIITKLSPTGTICLFSPQRTHLTADVVGYGT